PRLDVALQAADVVRGHAVLGRDPLHRALPPTDPAGGEDGLVAELAEPGAEVGDVERGSPDVQAGDDAQDADRLLGHARERSPILQPSRAGSRTRPAAWRTSIDVRSSIRSLSQPGPVATASGPVCS